MLVFMLLIIRLTSYVQTKFVLVTEVQCKISLLL